LRYWISPSEGRRISPKAARCAWLLANSATLGSLWRVVRSDSIDGGDVVIEGVSLAPDV
jgi:hypothetical protein